MTSQAIIIDDSNVTMASPADVPARRQQLINFIWGTAGFPPSSRMAVATKDMKKGIDPFYPTTVDMPNTKRVDRLDMAMNQGMKNIAYHFIPLVPNGRLVIVHQGHDVDFDSRSLYQTVSTLLADGYGVVAAFMPCWNPVDKGPGPGCPVGEPHVDGYWHNDMFAQIHPAAGEGSTFKYFVEHVAMILNYLQSHSAADGFPAYSEFDMTGVSGGGWTTVLYAAVDPRIRVSIACSGSKPLYMRRCNLLPPGVEPKGACQSASGTGYDGDREQMDPSLYQVAGYLDLYAFAAAGTGRRHIQVQLRQDAVFSEGQYLFDQGTSTRRPNYDALNLLTWAQAVRAYEKKLQTFFTSSTDNGWFRYEIDEHPPGDHMISPSAQIQTILAELDGDRRPFGAVSSSDVYTKGLTGTLFHAPPSWADTGFPLVGAPAIIESGTTTHVFFRDPDSLLVHLTGTNGTNWQKETFPGGVIVSDPAAVMRTNRLEVVAANIDLHLVHWSKSGTVITSEVVNGSTEVMGPPALVASAGNRLDAFIRQYGGAVSHFSSTGGAWSSEAVPGTFRGFPAAVAATADATLRMYGRGTNESLYENSIPLAGGSWFQAILPNFAGAAGTKMAGSPGVTISAATSKALVATRNPDGTIDQYELAGAWSHLNRGKPTGSAGITFAPVPVPTGIFVRAVEGRVWFFNVLTGTWVQRNGQIF